MSVLKISRSIVCAMIVCMCLMASSVQAQMIREWNSITSMYDVRQCIQDKSILYAATNGGVFRYDIEKKEGKEIRVAEDALLSSNCTAIGLDTNTNTLWVGAENGELVIYNTLLGTWTPITAIVSANNLASKRIRTIAFADQKVFVSGDFGIMVFSEKGIPGDWISRIGTLSIGTPVKDMNIINDTIWVCTDKGIAKSWIKAPLQLSQSWTNYDSKTLSNSDVLSLTSNNDILYAATASTIVRYNNGTFIEQTIPSTKTINDLSKHNEEVLFSDASGIYILSSNQALYSSTLYGLLLGHATMNDGSIIAYLQNGGIARIANGTTSLIKPNTPSGNKIQVLALDNQQRIWACLEEGGFSTIWNDAWKNYSAKDIYGSGSYPKFIALSLLQNGSMIIGNFGSGIAEAIESSDTMKIRAMSEEERKVLAINQGVFTVSGQAKEDRNGNVWITRLTDKSPADGGVIVCKKNDGTLIPYIGTTELKKYTLIEIDNSSTKWLASTTQHSGSGGIYYFNEKNTLDNENDDVTGSVFFGKDIRAIKKDNVGIVWIGANDGLYAVYNPSSVLSGRQPNPVTISILKDQVINDIAIDAENNKWIATDKGVFVINEDGTEIIESYTKLTAPFQSNEIKAIAIDRIHGLVYCGTSVGLYIGTTTSITPSQDYSSIRCYPQPFVPEEHTMLTVEGLASETSISIVTPNGQPIRTLQTKSGKVLWDGKDESGSIVGNGVYLFLTQSGSSDQSGVMKCMVKHRGNNH